MLILKGVNLVLRLSLLLFIMQAGVCLWELVNKSKGVRLDRKIIKLMKKVVNTWVQVHLPLLIELLYKLEFTAYIARFEHVGFCLFYVPYVTLAVMTVSVIVVYLVEFLLLYLKIVTKAWIAWSISSSSSPP